MVMEALFDLAHSRQLCLMVQYLLGQQNVWADALSRSAGFSLQWVLWQWTFCSLTSQSGSPDIDMFAVPDSHFLPCFLSRFSKIELGDLDTVTVDWNRWPYSYLFPSPVTSVLLRVNYHLHSHSDRIFNYCPSAGSTTMVHLASMVVPLSLSSFWCKGINGWGYPCAYTHKFLMHVLSQLFTSQVVANVLGHCSYSCNQ